MDRLCKEFSDKYEIGVREIDEQHRKFYTLMTDFQEKIKEGYDRKTLNILLYELKDYLVYHFLEEERLMKKHDYPLFEEHRRFHEMFREKILKISEKIKKDSGISLNMLHLMQTWFISHILTVDKHIGNYINSKNNTDEEQVRKEIDKSIYQLEKTDDLIV